MALNLEGFRIEIARAMYEDSIGSIDSESWFEQPPEIRDGFIKLAAAVFDKMWGKDARDLVEFFAGHLLVVTEGCGKSDVTIRESGELRSVICRRRALCSDCKVKVLTHDR